MQVLLVYRPESAEGGDANDLDHDRFDGVEVFGLFQPDAELLPLVTRLTQEHPEWQFYITSGVQSECAKCGGERELRYSHPIHRVRCDCSYVMAGPDA